MTNSEIVLCDKAQLTWNLIKKDNVWGRNNVKSDLNLVKAISPMNGIPAGQGSTVVWTSDNPGVISENGVVTRGDEDQIVKLTAEIISGTAKETVEFLLTVLAEYSDDDRIAMDAATVTWDMIKGGNKAGPKYVMFDLEFPEAVTDGFGSTITWKSSNEEVISKTGVVTQASKADITVTLTAEIKYKTLTLTKTFEIAVPAEGFIAPRKGDINRDGEITIDDAIMMFKVIAKKIDFETELTEIQKWCGDVTETESIVIDDAIMVFKHIARKIEL